ncbi:MAG: polysulfide reductase NrfD [Sulfurospirillum sp.]|nr:polysulfide reductase NrfD [Sulfurospirillum sp.]MBL0703766.1 polysulfide reductase NrfD [Sulfurospirillum sp.]
MNNMWGSMAQYDTISWPWPIAIYLFLAGLSAGSIMVALLVKWNIHEEKEDSIWDAMVKSGAIIAPITIIIGLFLLIIDLGKPLSFYWLLVSYNFASVMTLGVLALFVYTPIVLIFTMLVFEDDIKKIGLLSLLLPFIAFIKSFHTYTKIIEYIVFGLAIIIGAYTGFLLSANNSIPLWNSPILPVLFLTSGISAGVAANILIGLIFFKSSINKESIKYLLIMDLRVVLIELPLIGMLFVGMMYTGGDSLVVAKKALTIGYWAKVFWIGVIGVGLIAPLVITFTALKNHAYKVGYIILNSLVVLLGVVMLRFYIVYAGQLFTGA